MPWYTAVPALTPVAAWDAMTFDGLLRDQVGTCHIAVAGSPLMAFPYASIVGEEKPWPLSAPLTMPAPPYVLAAFVRHQRRGVVFCKGLNSDWNYWFGQIETGVMYQGGASAYGSVGAGPAFGTPKFLALVVTASGASFYCNGAWTSTSVPLAWIGDQIGYVGYLANGNEYNFSSDEAFHAAGLWTGAANLSDVQALEAACRAALVPPPAGARFSWGERLVSPQSDQWNQPGVYPAVTRAAPPARANIYFGGNGRIVGTVKEKGTPDRPLVREVLLWSENTRTLVASTWSAADGSYAFDGLDRAQRYTVLAYDYTHTYRAVVADNLTPEVMP